MKRYRTILFSLWLFLSFSLTAQTPLFKADLQPQRGLTILFKGVPIIRANGVSFLAADGSKYFYVFDWMDQPRSVAADETVTLQIGSANSPVLGSLALSTTATQATVRFKFKWQHPKAAQYTINAAQIWLPNFEHGRLEIDGLPTRALTKRQYDHDSLRFFTKQGSVFQFSAPMGRLKIQSADKWSFKDNRTNPTGRQRWVEQTELAALSQTGLLKQGDEIERSLVFSFEDTPVAKPTASSPTGALRTVPTHSLALKTQKIAAAQTVNTESFPILPQPKKVELIENQFIPLVSKGLMATSFDSLFANALRQIWAVPAVAYRGIRTFNTTFAPALFAQTANPHIAQEAYQITVSADSSITIRYQTEAALHHAAQTLAQLARFQKGGLVLPVGKIMDYPSTHWRGIHMFVGPTARQFHQQMFERVLIPLKMNKVLFQCEQTDWASQPKIKNPITMPLAELAQEFDWIRSHQIEPIPMIQSFGHMEWLFANGQNLDLAYNPEVPYSIDPRKEAALSAIKQIWQEAIAALKPQTIHFGLDEVDMVGFPDDPELVTSLWEKHLPFLDSIAQAHQLKPMLWGDKALAPGEALDATHGFNAEHTARRRAAIPKGALIGDWHYAGNPDPEKFRKSLQIWKTNGLIPVASTWFNGHNIRSFNHAAIAEGVGTLQTTWAKYESCETNMLKNMVQFGAYIHSLDYAWSGRTEKPEDLPYDAVDLWRTRFYRQPEPLSPQAGFLVGQDSAEIVVGNVRFKKLELDLVSILSAGRPSEKGGTENLPETIELSCDATGHKLALLLAADIKLDQDEALADINLRFADGTSQSMAILYGRHVRAPHDARPAYIGETEKNLSRVFWDLGSTKQIKSMRIQAANRYAGLKIRGITVLTKE